MTPLERLPDAAARGLVGLLFDLDDTVLSHGVLSLQAYQALWDLHAAGLRLVAVTGRPSGWGEVLARQWPIDAVVAENGAVFITREGRSIGVAMEGDAKVRAERRARLDALVREAHARFPGVALADDNGGRRTDVAWDIGENASVDEPTIAALSALATSVGARTTRSSVHLHATFERDDKASGALRLLTQRFGEDAGAALHRWAFVGDSANDAPCFSAFHWTFGVANVRAYVRRLSVPPRFVAKAERGDGFAEIARTLLVGRSGRGATSSLS